METPRVEDVRLTRSVVLPVVRSVVTPEELEQATAFRYTGSDHVHVEVVARGEAHLDLLDDPTVAGPCDDAALAARLADRLEDRVCETAFAWGQRRAAIHELPDA